MLLKSYCTLGPSAFIQTSHKFGHTALGSLMIGCFVLLRDPSIFFEPKFLDSGLEPKTENEISLKSVPARPRRSPLPSDLFVSWQGCPPHRDA